MSKTNKQTKTQQKGNSKKNVKKEAVKKETLQRYTRNAENITGLSLVEELTKKHKARLKDHEGTQKSVIVKFRNENGKEKPLLEILCHSDSTFTVYVKKEVVVKAKMQKAFTDTKYFIQCKRAGVKKETLEKIFTAAASV